MKECMGEVLQSMVTKELDTFVEQVIVDEFQIWNLNFEFYIKINNKCWLNSKY